MGTVYAEITLKNAGDFIRVKEGLIIEQNVRKAKISAVVDTGAMTLVISEAVCEELGLEIQEQKVATLANNTKEICKVTEPVEIQWKNRRTSCEAMVIPGAETVLLGAIPLEGMDLMVNPVNLELVGVHGETEEFLAL